ncbi:MAG: hypothetical protein K2Z80_33595 [Xanthobacteraceae bacterium]|nr:hypothetical protein [Xanthobacteraceae bacterium]
MPEQLAGAVRRCYASPDCLAGDRTVNAKAATGSDADWIDPDMPQPCGHQATARMSADARADFSLTASTCLRPNLLPVTYAIFTKIYGTNKQT